MKRLFLLLSCLFAAGLSAQAGTAQQLPALDEVTYWADLIGVNLDEETIMEVVASDYDMVVLDFIPSVKGSTDYPMAEVIAQLHNAPRPKLVIAYIDIGQAEEYRTYWQPDWGIGNPEWIVSTDPEGWEGDYPVAYWYDEWRAIWLDDGGYLQTIVELGFDGVYLDWIGGYSDADVMAFAEADSADPLQEMIWWVQDIAEYSRALRPDFIVIAQNAAELAAYDEYAEVIDAISQEHVWFDGGADNDPPGDCPLPRTEDEVESTAYVQSLSGGCLRLYTDNPESTLHTSSEYYLEMLQLAQQKSVTIFTVDYALQAENVQWVYCTARALGFIPFVGHRALDRYQPPYTKDDC